MPSRGRRCCAVMVDAWPLVAWWLVNVVGFRAGLERDDDRGEGCETGRDEERQAVAVHQGAAVAVGGRGGGGGEDRQPDPRAALPPGRDNPPPPPPPAALHSPA